MKRLLSTILGTLMLGALALAPPAWAETPDGETPAEESICDNEVGARKGLCNAFCEAMDCHLDEGIHASPKACDKVLANYQSKQGKGDNLNPPCLLSGCAQTATKAANDYYYACIENPKGCNEAACAKGAQSRYRLIYKKCIAQCRAGCRAEYNSCRKQVEIDFQFCIEAAGDPNDPACVAARNEGHQECAKANTQCTSECSSRDDPNYDAPDEQCPI